jgi:hypothetical protein
MESSSNGDALVAEKKNGTRRGVASTERWFRSKRHRDARPRQLETLLKLGWQQIGRFWLSPYSNLRYDEGTAITVESLRGTFVREWKERKASRRE